MCKFSKKCLKRTPTEQKQGVHFRKVFTLERISWKWNQTHKWNRFLKQKHSSYLKTETVSSLQFFALEMRERKAYRKETGSNVSVLLNKVSALEHDRFKQVSLYTASCGCLQIRLSHKLDYERSGFNTYQIVSLFQWFKQVFVLKQKKNV